jgi:hypothetical protein
MRGLKMPRCNNWTPAEGACDAPLSTAQEIADGCCSRCAQSLDKALQRHLAALPSFERRIAAEAGPDLAEEAIEIARAALDADPSIAF